MYKKLKYLAGFATILLLAIGAGSPLMAQAPGSIHGVITDPSAAVVQDATVQVTGNGITRTGKSDAEGRFVISVPPGTYNLRADAPGFVTYTKDAISVTSPQPVNVEVTLAIATESQHVQVQEVAADALSTDPSANVGAIVLSGDDLDALPDDPDDLQNDLEALAGPAAGPNGAQFFVDGFSGGQLPPKSSIREIRINSNPFSSEYDRPGFGRIEILTRPGANQFHGSALANFGDEIFDSTNPFLSQKPGYTTKMLEGNVSGPLDKKTSFQLEFSRRAINQGALINARVLDSNLNEAPPLIGAYPTPNRFWNINPRIDRAITPNHTLVLRYSHTDNSILNGIGGTSLPSQGSQQWNKNNQVQITETSVLGTKAVAETRFQFRDNHTSQSAVASFGTPQVTVSGAFTTGGAPFTTNYNFDHNLELYQGITLTEGRHTIKAGGRIRQDDLTNQSTSNFNGSYTFSLNSSLPIPQCLAGYTDPTALDLYQATEVLLQTNTISQVQALGCGPTQFTQRSGNAIQQVRQLDLGMFVQDDWRFRPNLTISAGLRYETQNNIHDHNDWAPRVALAWAPRAKANRPSKTVLRAGWGIFYDRFADTNVLNALRFNGVNQANYQLTSGPATPLPPYYPAVPPADALKAGVQQQVVYVIDPNQRAPYMMQAAFSVERSLPGRTNLSVNYINSRGVHTERQRNVNAPFPGTYGTAAYPAGIVPYLGVGPIYSYESSGLYKQTQVMVNMNTRLNAHIQLNGYYALGFAHSNASGFPMDQYNTALDWGRAAYDNRHRSVISGNIGLPFKVVASPFVTINSGAPFNITTGGDYNGNQLFNARPGLATAADNPKTVRVTPYGTFNLSPLPGEPLIPINYAEGPGMFAVNIRLSRTWGFGNRAEPGAAQTGGGGRGGPGGGGPGGGGGRGGGMRGGGFGGGGRGGGGFGAVGGTGKKYNVTLSANARNVLNHVNLNQPVGSLSSPQFGESTNIASGGGGPFGGGGGAAGNRRIELQLRLQF